MKKEIPILFRTAMVQSNLAGRKTNTRRTTDLDEINKEPDSWAFKRLEIDENGKLKAIFSFNDGSEYEVDRQCHISSPYGKPGDILWVRETWRKYCRVDADGYTKFDEEVIEFAADGHVPLPLVDGDGFRMYNKDGTEKYVPWRPSIHMPKVTARIWLEVTDIRVERLQDISEADAIAEGVEHTTRFQGRPCNLYMNYVDNKFMFSSPGLSFSSLWISLNGKESWQINPWVWVVKFKVLSTTGKPALQEKPDPQSNQQ